MYIIKISIGQTSDSDTHNNTKNSYWWYVESLFWG